MAVLEKDLGVDRKLGGRRQEEKSESRFWPLEVIVCARGAKGAWGRT